MALYIALNLNEKVSHPTLKLGDIVTDRRTENSKDNRELTRKAYY